jgi:hypothetical protein
MEKRGSWNVRTVLGVLAAIVLVCGCKRSGMQAVPAHPLVEIIENEVPKESTVIHRPAGLVDPCKRGAGQVGPCGRPLSGTLGTTYDGKVVKYSYPAVQGAYIRAIPIVDAEGKLGILAFSTPCSDTSASSR